MSLVNRQRDRWLCNPKRDLPGCGVELSADIVQSIFLLNDKRKTDLAEWHRWWKTLRMINKQYADKYRSVAYIFCNRVNCADLAMKALVQRLVQLYDYMQVDTNVGKEWTREWISYFELIFRRCQASGNRRIEAFLWHNAYYEALVDLSERSDELFKSAAEHAHVCNYICKIFSSNFDGAIARTAIHDRRTRPVMIRDLFPMGTTPTNAEG